MTWNSSNTLTGKVAVVTGATRGAGRGIALELGTAGATVYCTGRSVRGGLAGTRPETIDETIEMVKREGSRILRDNFIPPRRLVGDHS